MWSVTCEREIIRDGEFLQKFRQRKIGFTENVESRIMQQCISGISISVRNNRSQIVTLHVENYTRKGITGTISVATKTNNSPVSQAGQHSTRFP